MTELSLITSPLFRVHCRQSRAVNVSLSDIYQRADIVRFDYPSQLMNVLATSLAVGLTEAQIHFQKQRPDQAHWIGMILKEETFDSILAALSDAAPGLALTGNVAFMQMPSQLFDDAKDCKPIDQLFQPHLIAGGTTKGLRQTAGGIHRVCAPCATVGLYGYHAITAAVSKYWSTAFTNEGLITALGMAAGPLARSLIANVLHQQSLERFAETGCTVNQPFKNFPWVPDTDANLGLNTNDSLPFERFLNPEQQRGQISDYYLPLIRAVRLIIRPNEKESRCDLCGQRISEGSPVCDGFWEVDEQNLFGCIGEQVREAYIRNTFQYNLAAGEKDEKKAKKTPSAVNFKRLYRHDLKHPQLNYLPAQEGLVKLKAPLFADSFVQRKPVWAKTLALSGEAPAMIIQQFVHTKNSATRTSSLSVHRRWHEISRELLVTYSGVSYKKGRDVSALVHVTLSYDKVGGVLENLMTPGQLSNVDALIEFADQLISALGEASKKLHAKIGLNQDRNCYKVENGDVFRKDPVWLTMADQLWENTLGCIIELSTLERRDERDRYLLEAKNRLKKNGYQILSDYISDTKPIIGNLSGIYLEIEALKVYEKKTKPKTGKTGSKKQRKVVKK